MRTAIPADRSPVGVRGFLRRVLPAAVACLALLAAGCTGSDSKASTATAPSGEKVIAGPKGYAATIRRTTDGVPHIWGAQDEDVYFGQGWASAQDHPCDLVDQIIKISSQRSATFGPGDKDKNVTTDFGWGALGIAERAKADWPHADQAQRKLFEAFSAGWNGSLAQQGNGAKVTDWCKGQGWLRPITAEEAYSYGRAVVLLASGARLIDYIAKAQPPGTAPAAPAPGTEGALGDMGAPESTLASNGWAIGSQRSASGKGMLLANPHFPWIGELRFSEVHLTSGAGMNVYGAQLLGLPLVGIGFTDGVGWTHTVSAGRRFTAYKMTLAPGQPTSYVIDGKTKPMTTKEVIIKVKKPDGTTEDRKRTYYSTEFGPVLDFPGVGWTDAATTSYRDANIDNKTFPDQYMAMDHARSLRDLIAAHRKYQGVPLFNTIATGRNGDVWYADTAATPALSADAIAAYEQRLDSDGLTKLAAGANAVLLDGSTSRDAWVDMAGAPWPGVLPFDKLPGIQRRDYVMNANDSYWVPNAEATIAGDYSPLQGLADTARSARTLQNLAVLSDRSAQGASGADGKFDLGELQAAALADGGYLETQWRAGVVERCRAATGPVTSKALTDKAGAVVVPPTPVDVSRACDVLAGWDGKADPASVGEVLWREFTRQVNATDLWGTPFDKANPATTPADLGAADKDGSNLVLVGLASAIALLDKAGVALDSSLGSAQYDARVPAKRLPLPGGLGGEGITNVVDNGSESSSTMQVQPNNPKPLTKDSPLTTGGYPISYGTSFLMALDLGGKHPTARSVLTYGQVGDTESPLFTSQSELFGARKWKDVAFTESQIDKDQQGRTAVVSG